MRSDNLSKRLGALGFPLFERERVDANLTLADVVRSKDLRLWEGFPVVLANSFEKELFNYDEVNQYLKVSADKSHFDSLVVMSLALYRALNLKFLWAGDLYKTFSKKRKEEFDTFLKKLKNNSNFQLAGKLMSSRRLKVTFDNYANQRQKKVDELLLVKKELGVEYALSQLFSPKQKELFFKKLRGEKLTKTEKEYFSRVVKKKVLALANPEAHYLAQKLLK